jgi:hypothetical protein
MSKTIYGYQWSEHQREVNFGDLITEVLLNAINIKYKPYTDAPYGAPTCLMVGTILDKDRVESLTRNGNVVHIWGSGYRGDATILREAQNVNFHAVRGPMTRDMLWLTRSMPLGDPALLLTRFYDRKRNGRIIAVPHWESINSEIPTGFKAVSPLCKRDEVLDTIMAIAGADFVLAGSLHAAIIAHAYGVPWAFWGPCSEKGGQAKWTDWAGFLGVGVLYSCHTLLEAKAWWDRVGSHIPGRSFSPLFNSFPREAVVDWKVSISS